MSANATTASTLAKATALCGVKLKRPDREASSPPKFKPRERPPFALDVDSSCATAALMRERKASVGTPTVSSGATAVQKKAVSLSADASASAHDSHAATCAAASPMCS